MNTQVIAKFRCDSVQEAGTDKKIGLRAIMPDDSDDAVTREENEKFWQSTPQGHTDLTITNPNAGSYFVKGQDYYLHFEKVQG